MDSNPIVIAMVVTVLFVAIIGLVVIVIRKRNGKKRKRKQSFEIQKSGKYYLFERSCLLKFIFASPGIL